jgi:hypothetical protein
VTVPTVQELEALADFCRKNGLRRLKAGDIELEFGPEKSEPTAGLVEKLAERLAEQVPSDEDMLNWSAPQTVVDLERAQKNGTGGGNG